MLDAQISRLREDGYALIHDQIGAAIVGQQCQKQRGGGVGVDRLRLQWRS